MDYTAWGERELIERIHELEEMNETVEKETLLFYVVDSNEDNEELFTTRASAEKYAETLKKEDKPRIRICEVQHAYRDGDGWNYDDYSDTFDEVITLSSYTN